MTRTPTAEEVLGLHMQFREAANKWVESDDNDGSLEKAYMAAAEKWEQAYQQWQAAQGPVTREWFINRFGREYVHTIVGTLRISTVCDDVQFGGLYLDNPTRSDIERLVRVLGGKER